MGDYIENYMAKKDKVMIELPKSMVIEISNKGMYRFAPKHKENITKTKLSRLLHE